jgi:bifunctional non-homologous end joining protein LigD
MAIRSTSLGFQEGSSDKVYHVQVESYRAGFIVNFQFGRRGGTFQSGTKTRKEVPQDEAIAIYEGVIAEKVAKGYTVLTTAAAAPKAAPIPNPAIAPPARAAKSDLPMLLNVVSAERFLELMRDDGWMAQEKKDGHRRSIRRLGSEIGSGNRKGEDVPLPAPVAEAVLALKTRLPADLILDGELMGDVYWPFDLLRYTAIDMRGQAVERRWSILNGLLDTIASPALGRIPTAFTTAEKVALYDRIVAEGGEGMVFKKLGSKYTAGRPGSGGNALKFKFLGSATCIVTGQNGEKASVGLAVLDGKEWIEIGNVTIPPNHKLPTPGTLVEVEYMNILRGGSLYQAVYKGERDDKTEADTYASLHFKGEGTATPIPAPAPAPRPTVAEARSSAAAKAVATRQANHPAAAKAMAAAEPGTMNAAHKAWATRRAKAAAAAA